VDLCPVILPGRESRLGEPGYTDLDVLTPALADALWPLMRRTPYAFVGHSMGAWIAYALTCELRRRRRDLPEHLFLSARRAPDVPSPRPALYHLPEAQFIEAIQDRYNAIPQKILDNPTFLRMFLPGLRADFTLLDTWTPPEEPPLAVPITAFVGTQDAVVPAASVREWRRFTTESFQLRQMPGGHFFLRESSDLFTEAIAGTLRRYL
jgi:surfactin synthase thioesterase subunit